jgi:hypothetical protein
MILIGCTFCKHCKEYHKKHPEIPYIEIPDHVTDWDSKEGKAKKALLKLNIHGVPVILDNSMTKVLGWPR